jgi:hypothetical protein
MPEDRLEIISKTVQVVSVVAGVVISLLSFNHARQQEAHARAMEAEKQKVEAAKDFLGLRQRLYLETVQQAAVLANPEIHSQREIDKARKRFRQLYVAELSMIEAMSVEQAMMNLAQQIDPDLVQMTPKQAAAYKLSHALRDSLTTSWKLDQKLLDNPNP